MAQESQTDYLIIQQRILRIVGVSLREKESFWYNVFSYIVVTCTFSLPLNILYSIFTNNYPFEILLEHLAFFSGFLTACVKSVGFFRVRKQLGKYLRTLQSGIFAPNINRGGPLEQSLIDECTFYVHTKVVILMGLSVASLASAVGETLFRKYTTPDYWVLPYGGFALLPIDTNFNFYVALCYQFVFVSFMTTTITAVTTFIAGVMAHVSYQCKILQNFIRTSVVYAARKTKQDENTDPSNIPWSPLQITLKEIVEYHSAIIELADQFERALNILALTDFLGISFGICTALIGVSMNPTFDVRLIKNLALVCGNTFLQFITAYWGNEVMLSSIGVAQASSEVDFIGTDIRFQKSWVVIMQRSQQPIQFTVGRFAPLSLDVFAKVIKSAYSYFMLLRHMTENITN